MIVKCVWCIVLPFKFTIDKGVNLSKFVVDDISIMPIKTKGSEYFDSIEVEYVTDIQENLLPKDEYDSMRTLDFKKDTTKKIGVKVNYFVNSYYRQVESNIINQIFNGDDFTTHYQMGIFDMEGNPVDGILSSNAGVRVLNKKLIDDIINDINTREKDIVDELMRMAQCFLENGYFDMAIMNLAMAQESFVKTYVFSKGLTVQDVNEVKGYVDKFFHIGLKKAKGQSLKEEMPECFQAVSFINDIRNEIAHGGSIYYIEEFKQKSQDEIYNLIDNLISYVEEVVEWINE